MDGHHVGRVAKVGGWREHYLPSYSARRLAVTLTARQARVLELLWYPRRKRSEQTEKAMLSTARD